MTGHCGNGLTFFVAFKIKETCSVYCVVGTAILSSFNSIAGENCDWEELIIYNGIKRQATFCVELATTYSERQQGLMFREDLEFNEGMIFVYDQPKPVSFWMKNTSIPLDIIFADGSGTVTKIFKNAVPFSTVSIFGGEQVQYVLEINAGLSKSLGIKLGNILQHRLIGSRN